MLIKRLLMLAAMVGPLCGAHGFSLLGPLPTDPNAAPQPPADWQVPALGYDLAGDIGGPMNIGEEYRYNSPHIRYAFDQSFLIYFGQRGVEAVEEALQIMNELPAVSAMSEELTEFPTENKKVNGTAEQLGLLDLKSYTMRLLLEILGLAEPERWVWSVRQRFVETFPGGFMVTNYFVIQRNFDPVTLQPTNRVNDAFYTYTVDEPLLPGNYTDALESSLDPVQFTYSSVAGGFLLPGELYTGLTRDDAGGWRYLLRQQNFNVETLPPNTTLVPGFFPGTPGTPGRPGTGGPRGGPWTPYVGLTNLLTNVIGNVFSPWTPITGGFTNIPGIPGTPGTPGTPGGTNLTNLVINAAVRPGVEKITFIRTEFDSILGQAYFPQTNFYNDTVISNFTAIPQFVQRVTTFPDLLFTAEDLGFPNNSIQPFLTARGNVFVNNDLINGNTTAAGPGVITGPMSISFSNILPGQFNSVDEDFLNNSGPFPINQSVAWGSFDATGDPPIVYPDAVSLQEIEAMVLRQ